MASRTFAETRRIGYGTIDEISSQQFYLLTAVWTLLGLAGTAITSYVARDLVVTWPVIIAVLLVQIVGIFIGSSATRENNVTLGVIGYALVALPAGLILGPLVSHFAAISVIKALVATGAMVAVFGLVGVLIPDSLSGWGSWITGLLIASLVGYLLVPLAGLFGVNGATALNVLDWITLFIFAGVVIYDFNMAKETPRTASNAMFTALGIYLDFVNIFIRLLRLFGSDSSD